MLAPSASFALFDDNLTHAGDVLLSHLADVIVCNSAADLNVTFAAIEAARKRGYWIAIAANYEFGYAFEPRLRACLDHPSQPLLSAWVFERAQRLTAADTERQIAAALDRLDEHGRSAGVAAWSPMMSAAAYRRAVERIVTLIDSGDCYQVNFTFALEGELFGDPLALYAALRERQPVRFGAFVQHPTGSILSRSPELFVERVGNRLVCKPMKGTAPRQADPESLRQSEKDRAENLMIVDLIRNDLGRLAPPGAVRVEKLFELEPFPSVWQMTSTISADPVEADLATVFRALFPCGSITGAPKIRAMEIIHELELAPRGLYCGALGWVAPHGDFRFSVPIRTLVADRDARVRLGLGSGIVADSDIDAEWDECLLKSRFVTARQAPFGLIETLRCEPREQAPYPLFDRHLRRLEASVAHFGFESDLSAVRDALLTHAATLARAHTHRVRLQIESDGRFRISSAALQPLPEGLQTVVVSPARVASGDRLLHHKTTARALYDAELARVNGYGHFDVLFFNERDELTEGARSNVFVDMGDGPLYTPPLDSGVLDGVYRRKLLDEGRACEARLGRGDLAAARTIHVGNALRGLIRVRLDQALALA